jgi:hypothetical protein
MDVIFTRGVGLEVQKKRVTAGRITPAPSERQVEGIRELQEFGSIPIDRLVLPDALAEGGARLWRWRVPRSCGSWGLLCATGAFRCAWSMRPM